jgi:RNA polymerase sigma factor (sigma-70 family)
MIPPDSELLQRYCREKSENAFAQLVERHLDLVYAAALRQSGNHAPIAERITQAVFTELAQQADRLQGNAPLTAWLYARTRISEANAASQQTQRRSTPEPLHAPPPSGRITDSEQLERALEAAIDKIEEVDREALLLHYREGLGFRTVGAALGLSDEAARARVARALDEIREILIERGVTSPATLQTLGTVLSAFGLVKAPAGLGRSIARGALASSGAGSGLSSFWQANRMKLALSALFLIALITALTLVQRSRTHLAAEMSALRSQNEKKRSATERNRQTADPSAEGSELQRLRKAQRDPMRLRAASTEPRHQVESPPRADPSEAEPEPPLMAEPDSPVVKYFANPSAKLARGQTLVTGGWRTESGNRTLLLVTPEISEGDAGVKQVNFQMVWVAGPDDVLAELGLDGLFTDNRTNDAAHLLSQAQTRILMAGLVGGTGVEVLTAPRVTTKEGLQARIDVTQSKTEEGGTLQVGPAVELTHTIGADGTLDLTVNAQFSELKRKETGPNEPETPALDAAEEDTDAP